MAAPWLAEGHAVMGGGGTVPPWPRCWLDQGELGREPVALEKTINTEVEWWLSRKSGCLALAWQMSGITHKQESSLQVHGDMRMQGRECHQDEGVWPRQLGMQGGLGKNAPQTRIRRARKEDWRNCQDGMRLTDGTLRRPKQGVEDIQFASLERAGRCTTEHCCTCQ